MSRLVIAPRDLAAIGRVVFKGFGVIEHDFGVRHAGDEFQRRRYSFARQIHPDAEPLEERGGIGAKGTPSVSRTGCPSATPIARSRLSFCFSNSL